MPQQEAMDTLDPMLGGIHRHQGKAFGQPSNSADSHQTFDTPYYGPDCPAKARNKVPGVVCSDIAFGRFDENGAWQQQLPCAQRNASHLCDDTIALLASAGPSSPSSAAASADLPEDPAAAKAMFRQLTSQMTPTELTELQHTMRQQRLQRQQLSMFMQPPLEAAAVPALGFPAASLTPALPVAGLPQTSVAGAQQQSLGPADALRLVREAAVLLTAAMSHPINGCNPGFLTSFLTELAGSLAVQQTSSHFQQGTRHQRQHLVTEVPCFTDVAQPAPSAFGQMATAVDIHPGSTSCRAVRSHNRRPRTIWNPAALPWMEASTPLPPSPPSTGTAASLVPAQTDHHPPSQEAAAAAAGAAAALETNVLSSESSLKVRFSRLSAEVQASILIELHDLEAAEVERRAAREEKRAAREAAAANAQRRSSRTRKVKLLDDMDQQLIITNSNRSASPDSMAPLEQQRDSSADPNSSDMMQQQQPVKKRVRFADCGDTDSDDDDVAAAGKAVHRVSSESPDSQGVPGAEGLPVFEGLGDGLCMAAASNGDYDDLPVAKRRIVRRIGPRAQARKRMHKKTIRRRRPQRAPLS